MPCRIEVEQGGHIRQGVDSLSKSPELGMGVGYLGNIEEKLPVLRKFGDARE